MSNRPTEYEFTGTTKKDALRRANRQCEGCGQNGYLEIHHKLSIWAVVAHYPSIPAALIRSLANAKVLCPPCHVKADNEMRFVHPDMAAGLLGLMAIDVDINMEMEMEYA